MSNLRTRLSGEDWSSSK